MVDNEKPTKYSADHNKRYFAATKTRTTARARFINDAFVPALNDHVSLRTAVPFSM